MIEEAPLAALALAPVEVPAPAYQGRGPGRSDEWWTPAYVFEALGCRFDIDVASPPGMTTHVPASHFITGDSLNATWIGFVWMNPPFGGRNAIGPWLDKFFLHGHGIALTPDRTSAPWFREAWPKADRVLFTPKIRFLRPDGTEGKSPANGTALWASGERAVMALHRAARVGLGILAIPSVHQSTGAEPALASALKGEPLQIPNSQPCSGDET